MKKRSFVAFVISCFVVLICLGCTTGKQQPDTAQLPADSSEQTKAETQQSHTGGYLEGITFESMGEKERITVLLSKASGFDVARDSGKSVVLKLNDTIVPETLRQKQGEGRLRNVRFILPEQRITNGAQWVHIQITLEHMVPFRIKEDVLGYIVDFDVSTLSSNAVIPSVQKVTAAEKKASAMKTFELFSQEAGMEEGAPSAVAGETKKYTGEKIALLSFQNANIKSVLRAIAEYSGYNIVSGPDVKGKVTIHMKNVPWDQALDTVLEINSLGMKQFGDVITIMPLEKLKQAAAEQLKKDVSQGKLKQIAIEAKIVEVDTNFGQRLGINWGAGYQDTWNGKDMGVIVGNAASGTITTLPATGGIGLTNSSVAVNFPAAVATTPAFGLIAGAGKWILDARLEALETSGEGKIISSPKVTTLDNVEATIKQGEEIPYAVTDSEGGRTISFKDAVLKLEVKPTITPEGRISMEIKATNDFADWQKTNTSNENPPIVTANVESTIVVKNGDTIVLGGIFKTTRSESWAGVPFLSKIPVLGWLFKYKTVSSEKRELLIFVTPRIIEET